MASIFFNVLAKSQSWCTVSGLLRIRILSLGMSFNALRMLFRMIRSTLNRSRTIVDVYNDVYDAVYRPEGSNNISDMFPGTNGITEEPYIPVLLVRRSVAGIVVPSSEVVV